ncbi:ubiquitin-activating enzyme E1 [Nematocida sp. AWRm77]|nr:ubiquitin-activating enzyme E1 [Nematocida sp. AWRm77]
MKKREDARKEETKAQEKVFSPKLDEGLYSRQLYVMGSEAMKKMLKSHVLVVGLKKAGTEIAKNLSLAGIKNLSLYDRSPVQAEDLGTAFYCTESDIGDRVDKSIEYKVKSLNRYVNVSILEELPQTFEKYSAVVLCDASLEQQMGVNKKCRESKVPFISVRVRGLFFQLFCDFGESFITTDENGEDVFIGTIKNVSSKGEVTLVEEERHNLEDGDEIETKTEIPRRYKVKDTKAFKFSLEAYSGEDLAGVSFEQIKRHTLLHFKTLEESMDAPLLSSPTHSAAVMHNCFKAVDEIDKEEAVLGPAASASTSASNSASPSDSTSTPADVVERRVSAYTEKHSLAEEDRFVVSEFFRQPWGSIAPITSVAGGIAAHEVLKACSYKFRPLQQFMYYHALEMLPPALYKKTGASAPVPLSRYSTLHRIFGEDAEKIYQMGVFVIGAGAIGCEHLKNLAMLGAGRRNKVAVTDMDAIERSNLNRQFLFREEDISHMKSVVASREAAVLNADMSKALVAYTSKVGKETEVLYNDAFYAEIDIILNALDNVEARLYMDGQAIYHTTPMIDAGTLGTKGHTQSVVPFITENYGSSADPQEKAIPLCTIRNFPYLPVHCIEWALAEFKALFEERIESVRTAAENAGTESIPEEIRAIIIQRPRVPEDALVAAIKLFHRRFVKGPRDLITAFPPGHITEEGTQFWTPPKRIPVPAELSLENASHLSFLLTAQRLICKTFCVEEKAFTKEEIASFVEQAVQEADAEKKDDVVEGDMDLVSLRVQKEEFEKDSETNGHVEFVTAAANIRSDTYGIPNLSALEIKKIAGRIIPAIATTTAVVSGLAVGEAVKYVFWREEVGREEIYKNSYVSLALPLLATSDPLPPQKFTIPLQAKSLITTHWDKIEVADTTLGEVMKRLQEEWKVEEIPTLMKDLTMLYCSFYNVGKFKKNLEKKISEILYPEGVPAGVHSARLDAVIEDEEGNGLPVPFIKVAFGKQE